MADYHVLKKRLEILEARVDSEGIMKAMREFYDQVLCGSDPHVSPEVVQLVPPDWLILFDLVRGEDGFFTKRDHGAQANRGSDVKLQCS